MKIAWRHYRFSGDGESRGYLTAGFHIFKALSECEGVELFHCNEDGYLEDGTPIHNKTVLHFCPPHLFRPFAGKTNVLFSMWETDVIPDDILPFFAAADVRIVPSTYCQAVMERHGLSSEVAPLGILDMLASVDGSRGIIMVPGARRRLRFLFVGSSSLRKGWDLLSPAWRGAFDREMGDVQLYIKTIATKPEDRVVEEHIDGHVIVDKRDLSTKEMVELYLSADVFVFPTMAEAFGLPALEAMALGCLVIAPETGGLTEFVNGATSLVIEPTGKRQIEYGPAVMEMISPTASDLVPLLRAAYHEWGMPRMEAIRNTGMLKARSLTWGNTGRRVAEIAESLQPKKLLRFQKRSA